MYIFHFCLLVPSLYLLCVHTSVRRTTIDHVYLPHSLSTLFCCVRICAVCVCLCICICLCLYVCFCICVCVQVCAHVFTSLCRHLLGQSLTRMSLSISTNSLPHFLRQEFDLEFDILATLATGEFLHLNTQGYSHRKK